MCCTRSSWTGIASLQSRGVGKCICARATNAFDLLVRAGRNAMQEPLSTRRDLLERKVLAKLRAPVRYSPEVPAKLSELN
jgi:hypothetical protein